MKSATEIIFYTIKLSKQEFEDAMEASKNPDVSADFQLGYILSRALASYVVNKDTEII